MYITNFRSAFTVMGNSCTDTHAAPIPTHTNSAIKPANTHSKIITACIAHSLVYQLMAIFQYLYVYIIIKIIMFYILYIYMQQR